MTPLNHKSASGLPNEKLQNRNDELTAELAKTQLALWNEVERRRKVDRSLRELEEMHYRFLEAADCGIIIFDPNGNIVTINNCMEKITGYTTAELHRKGFLVLLTNSTERQELQKSIAAFDGIQNREIQLTRKDNTTCIALLNTNQTELSGQKVLVTRVQDISKNKLVKNSLFEKDEPFRLIAETIHEAIWIFDNEKDAITYISPAHEQIHGYSRKTVYETPDAFYDFIHPDDREKARQTTASMKTGQILDHEYRIVRPDGSIRHIWDRGFPVHDETGQINRVIGIARDISTWRQSEEALKESMDYLNQIINHIADPIFVVNRKHILVHVNEALCSFTGLSYNKLIGSSAYTQMSPEMATSLFEQDEEIFKTGRECITEDNIVDDKGDTHTLMTKKTLLIKKNGEKQIVGIVRDITEQKRLEAQFLQAQKMEAVGVLAGGVAHDFNNLLNVINGYSELALESLSPDSPLRQDIEPVIEAGKRAASLTSQLLAFSRKQLRQPEILNINDIISEMSSMLQRLIGEDVELSTDFQKDIGFINADIGQIHQIVMNLAVNARDAMPHGGQLNIETANVEFDEDYIKTHPMAQAGPYIMLAISDTGSGMDQKTKDRLFEPFFTTKGKGKGTGLGLSTVYGIVKQSDGFIWVYSEPGHGTSFKIYFPIANGEAARLDKNHVETYPVGGNETVLVVEDESSVRALILRILQERGYNVLEAKDGLDGLDIAEDYDGEIHLIITDVVMPGMGGKEMVSRLETYRPGIKTLYISGYTDSSIVHHGILNSDVHFLQKPFTAENLIRYVQTTIHSKSAG